MYKNVPMKTIDVFNVQRNAVDGSRFCLLFTYEFGFELNVKMGDDSQANFDTKAMKITYDPRRAVMKTNEKGYLTLFIN